MDSKLIRVILLLALSVPAFGQGKILAPIFFGQPSTGGVVWPSSFAYIASSITGCLNLGTGTKCVYALHQTPGAGHLLVLEVGYQSGTDTITVTDPNNTWIAAGSRQVGSGGLNGFTAQLFYVPSAVNAATTITVTISGSVGFIGWEAAEFSYTGTILTLDPTNLTGFNYSTTAASGGVATVNTAANTVGSSDLLLAACMVVDSSCSVGAGFTAQNDTNACSYNGTSCTTGQDFAGSSGAVYEYKTGVTAGSHSATFGAGTTDNVILGLIAF